MTPPTAIIRVVAEAVDDAVYTVGLSEHAEPDADSFALLLSIAEPDDEGWSCSVTAEPGQRTAFNAIESCELDGTRLHLRSTPDAAHVLALPRELTFELAVSSEAFQILENGLRRLGVT
jgi:hypothetical protein